MSRSVLNKRFGIPGLVMLIAAGGCGVSFTEETTTLDVVFDRSGTLARDGAFTPISIESRFPMIFVGDSPANQPACGIVSINLNSLPATAIVSRVVLNLRGATIPFEGVSNPFPDFGVITVDHVNVVTGITAREYVGGTISGPIATVPEFVPGQAITVEVTSAVNADRAAGRTISSFRFRFDAAPSSDSEGDVAAIEFSMEDPAQRPSATVTIVRQAAPAPAAP